uniref:Uncharacterized protein n=1 Tax=Parastrongyloides trichosuri TaxID=131310 RepID=A0A0N4ZQ54_PARTI
MVDKIEIDTLNEEVTSTTKIEPSKLELLLSNSCKNKNLVNFSLQHCYCHSSSNYSTRNCLLCSIKKLKRFNKSKNIIDKENMYDKYLGNIVNKKKIQLPNVIPWESGTNKFPSQVGSSPFGCYRNIVPNIYTPPHLTQDEDKNYELVIPYMTCPPLHPNSQLSSQQGCQPFGSFRNEICSVTYRENKIKMDNLVPETKKEGLSVIPKILIPPIEGKNETIFGKFRDTEVKTINNGSINEMSEKDKLKCNSIIRKIDDLSNTIAERDKKLFKPPTFGSLSKGDNDPQEKERKAEEYRKWMGGQWSIHTTFNKDNLKKSNNNSYYEKLMSERNMTAEELYYNNLYKLDTDMVNQKLIEKMQ